MAGILSLNNPLRQFDPFNRKGLQPQDQPFSPFKVKELSRVSINPLNPPETDTDAKIDENSIDTSPVFKSGLEQFKNVQTPHRDNYRGFLPGIPKREDHQLTKLGKALSLASGAAEGYTGGVSRGVQHGLGLMERPYQQALDDYSNKGGMLKELAGLEYQDIQDRQKLQTTIEGQELANRKELRELYSAMSTSRLNDAQIKNYDDIIKDRGWQKPEANKMTGILESVNTKTGETRAWNKVIQTVAQEQAQWEKRTGIDQAGRERIQRIQNQGQMDLAKLKDELEDANVDPVKVDKAYDLAFKVVEDRNKDLWNKVFEKDDDTGELTIKDGANPAEYQLIMRKVQQVTDAGLRKAFFGTQPSPPIYRQEGTGEVVDYSSRAREQITKDFANDPVEQRRLLANPAIIDSVAQQIRDKELAPVEPGLPGTHIGPGPAVTLPSPNSFSSDVPIFMRRKFPNFSTLMGIGN